MADQNDPAERRRTAWMMFDYLSQAPVLLPLAVPPPAGGPIVEVPETPAAYDNLMITIDPGSGHTAMVMFLDEKSLQAKFPGCRFVRADAKKVLELFVASRYDALFQNPGGQWMSWSRAQAAEVLEAGRQGPSASQ